MSKSSCKKDVCYSEFQAVVLFMRHSSYSYFLNIFFNGELSKKVNSKVSPNYFKLCLTVKFFTTKSLDDCNFLNKRSELVSKCRHQNKLLLCNIKGNDSMN